MIEGFNITEQEWEATPSSVRVAALSLNHQLRLLHARFDLHQQQFKVLKEKADQAERQLQAQVAENERLTSEVARLKEQLGLNSANSSLPPSSDSPFQKRAHKHEPSGLKQGAQPGHSGTGRWLLEPDELDQVVELRPESCVRCNGVKFDKADWLPTRRQVIEITDSGTAVTEYQRYALRCTNCGKRNRAEWIPEASTGAFGARVKAVIAYLTGRLCASHRDTVEAMNELFAVKIGVGSIAAVQRQISQALACPVAQLQQFVEQQSAVQCVDETSWREKNQQKWLWVSASKEATVFQVKNGRSTKDAQTVIGATPKNIITTDRYSAYNFIEAHRRQICSRTFEAGFSKNFRTDGRFENYR